MSRFLTAALAGVACAALAAPAASALETTASGAGVRDNLAAINMALDAKLGLLQMALNKVLVCNKQGKFFDAASTEPDNCVTNTIDLSDYSLEYVLNSKAFAYMDADGSNHTKTTKIDFSDLAAKRAETVRLSFAGRAKKGGTKMTAAEAASACATNPIIETLSDLKSTTSAKYVGDGTSRKLYSKETHTFDDSQYYYFQWSYNSSTKTLNLTNHSDNAGNMMLYFCNATYQTMQLVKTPK